MARILIAYQSYDGQTKKIARAMADAVATLGHEPELHNVADRLDSVEWRHVSGVLLGGPIHRGAHSGILADFVEKHRSNLEIIPIAFFSVSLSAAGNASQQDDAQRCLEEFLDDMQLYVVDTITIAGAIRYPSYGFFKRRLMRWIARKAGSNDLDMAKNFEYTNWERITAFVERFLSDIGCEPFAIGNDFAYSDGSEILLRPN